MAEDVSLEHGVGRNVEIRKILRELDMDVSLRLLGAAEDVDILIEGAPRRFARERQDALVVAAFRRKRIAGKSAGEFNVGRCGMRDVDGSLAGDRHGNGE